ncbi:hypothetical protein CCACVL1_17294 [Corchorus capsularis]|uniref:Uncharacterized protein n=1 Tax=Corchorus capsularis TaxID=210143 RepID=A0A1R3HT85_COCAP|nr:hypothetical protein CCACVL1_17294 [Corchorus capsularis]
MEMKEKKNRRYLTFVEMLHWMV